MIVMGLPAQLVSRALDCRQLQCGREVKSFLLVHGLVGVQDMGAITVFMVSMHFFLPALVLTYESVDQSGVHHFHQFGRDHLRKFQCFRYICPSSQKEFASPVRVIDMDEACCGGFR